VFDQHGLSSAWVPPNQARDIKIAIRPAGRDLPAIKLLGIPNIMLTPEGTRAQSAGGPKPG
jgi:hypothetical protein